MCNEDNAHCITLVLVYRVTHNILKATMRWPLVWNSWLGDDSKPFLMGRWPGVLHYQLHMIDETYYYVDPLFPCVVYSCWHVFFFPYPCSCRSIFMKSLNFWTYTLIFSKKMASCQQIASEINLPRNTKRWKEYK